MNPEAIIDFWFEEIEPKQWWIKNELFDREIRDRFGAVHASAANCECYAWRKTPLGRLAEIIVLDQFSRNIYRDAPLAFSFDALALAQEAVAQNADRSLAPPQRSFIYMPYMHSESAAIHKIAITLFDQPGLEDNLEFERKHKAVIDSFGRYPHRNDILGRESTERERAFCGNLVPLFDYATIPASVFSPGIQK